MGTVSSTLLMRMIDDVSGPARKIRAAMLGVDGDAKKLAAHAGKGGGPSTRNGAMAYLAAGGRYVATAAGGYVTAATAKAAYTQYADFDRKITRILITANAGAEEAERTKRLIGDIARETALPIGDVVEGLDGLVAAGRTLPDALAFLPSVARTAQAAGAEVSDISKTADAMGVSFSIAAREMETAFDTAVKLGKEGRFELKDQARYLPSILPMAATRGLKGLDGLRAVGAALQVIRKNSGTSEEAATAMTDVLGKLDSEETIKKLKKNFGVDLPRELKKAKLAGKDTFNAFLDIIEIAIKGDMENVNKIFADKEARRGLTALMQYRQEYRQLQETAKNSAGEVARDVARLSRDAAAASQQLANAWDKTMIAFGNTADAAGLTSLLEKIAANANNGAIAMERFVAALKEGKSVIEAIRIAGEMDKKSERDIENEVYRFHSGSSKDEVDEARSARERAAAARKTTEARERQKKALLLAQRLAKIAAESPDGKLPLKYREWDRAAREELSHAGVDEADQRLVDLSLGSNFDSSTEDVGHRARMGAKVGLPGYGGPMPRPKPEPLTIEATLQTKYDEAIAEARRAAAVIQQTFDGIAIRPRVEMPSIPNVSYEQGQRVQSMRDGSYSDNGGRR